MSRFFAAAIVMAVAVSATTEQEQSAVSTTTTTTSSTAVKDWHFDCRYWTHEGCDVCTSRFHTHCGWCGATNECMYGNSTGSFNRTCAGAWAWNNAQCSNHQHHHCFTRENCQSCHAANGEGHECGWCSSTGRCLPGNWSGPTRGRCPSSGSWVSTWHRYNCPNCAEHTSCKSCTDNYNCGWCPGTGGQGQCFDGNATGAYNYTARIFEGCYAGNNINSTHWKYKTLDWNVSQDLNCSVPATDRCNQYTQCSSCVNGPAECGWCESTKTCSRGNYAGPYQGTCKHGGWHKSYCPDCYIHDNCANCNDYWGCGWCNATGQCMSGNINGSFSGMCPAGGWNKNRFACNIRPQNRCEQHRSCGVCIAYGGCGWCDATSRCMSGEYNGPSNGTCGYPYWRWAVCSHCHRRTSCENCTESADCGWCHATGKCTDGNRTGPAHGYCPAGAWDWDFGQCSAARTPAPSGSHCMFLYNCSTCNADPNCGYCYASRQCMPGNEAGPTGGYQCFNNSWTSNTFQCANCDRHTTCSACTETSDCGWCNTGGGYGYCSKGERKGPLGYYCPANSWAWTRTSCMIDDCARKTDCGSCTTASSGDCGWCYTNGRCMKGNSFGPLSGMCPYGGQGYWAWQSSDCVNCAAATTCDSCTSKSFCGWCAQSSTCMDGNYTGPVGRGTFCPYDQWYKVAGSCPANNNGCHSYSNLGCVGCVNSPTGTCGFCSTTKICEKGSYSGPTSGSCSGADWSWYAEQCDRAFELTTAEALKQQLLPQTPAEQKK